MESQQAVDVSCYAGFWKRFIAFLIDFAYIAVISFTWGVLLGIVLAVFDIDSGKISKFVGDILALATAWLYYALMESSRRQATLGKMALSIKVTDMNGRKISFGRATLRFFAKILSGLLWCAGFIMAAFSAKRQALHDIIAGCLVVDR